MKSKPAIAVVAAVVSLVILSGCTSPMDLLAGGATKNPAKTAQNFLRAFGHSDTDAACTMTVDSDGHPVKKDTASFDQCQQVLTAATGRASSLEAYRNAKVASAELDGDTAHVDQDKIAGLSDDESGDLDLKRVDGRWYVDLGYD